MKDHLFISGKLNSPKFSKYNLLNYLTRAKFSTTFGFWVIIELFLTYVTLSHFNYKLIGVLVSILGGIVFWTIAEFLIHKYLFHLKINNQMIFKFHRYHHNFPNDKERILMPPIFGFPISLPVLFICYFIGGKSAYGMFFFIGFIFAYMIYDLFHYMIHFKSYENKIWKKLKLSHLNHHYKNSDKDFGVTTIIWDKVFKTKS